jgi:hypothetical protein
VDSYSDLICKVYIIGAVPLEISNSCQNKFRKAKLLLESRGFSVVNPVESIVDESIGVEEAVRINLQSLLQCDAVYILPCVTLDKSRNVELLMALKLNVLTIQAV